MGKLGKNRIHDSGVTGNTKKAVAFANVICEAAASFMPRLVKLTFLYRICII